MFITGKCKKCNELAIFDIANLTKEQVENIFKQQDFGHCAVGFHVEIGKMSDYYILDWSKTFITVKEAIAYNKEKRDEYKYSTYNKEI